MNARNTKPAAPEQKSAIVAEVNLSDRGNYADSSLDLSFANGERLQVRVEELQSGIIEMAILHGLKQKLVDAAAIARNPENGRAASIEDKFNAVKAVYDRLLSGQWNATRGEGGAAGAGGLLFRALCRMYDGKKTPEQLREYLAGKTDAEKAALRKNPKVADIIETIKAEDGRADGATPGEDLLAELEGGDE